MNIVSMGKPVARSVEYIVATYLSVIREGILVCFRVNVVVNWGMFGSPCSGKGISRHQSVMSLLLVQDRPRVGAGQFQEIIDGRFHGVGYNMDRN